MAAQEHWLGRWAMDSMLINVSTRPFGRAIRLPEDEVQPSAGWGFRNRRPRGGYSDRDMPGAVHGVSCTKSSEHPNQKGSVLGLLPENCRAPLSVCAPSTLPQPQCWRARVHLSEALLA